MARKPCDCLCSYNHPEQLGRCTGHGYRTMITAAVAPTGIAVDLCPKCRTDLKGAALAPIYPRATV